MTPDQDHELLEVLTRVNAMITAFSMDFSERRLDRKDYIKLALMLLDTADRVLKHMVEDEVT